MNRNDGSPNGSMMRGDQSQNLISCLWLQSSSLASLEDDRGRWLRCPDAEIGLGEQMELWERVETLVDLPLNGGIK